MPKIPHKPTEVIKWIRVDAQNLVTLEDMRYAYGARSVAGLMGSIIAEACQKFKQTTKQNPLKPHKPKG